MDCAHYRELLSASLDGELDPTQESHAEAHLRGCAGCQLWYNRAAHVTRVVRLAPVPASPDVAEAVLPGSRPRLSGVPVVRRIVLGVLAAAQLALAIAVFLAPESIADRDGHTLTALGHLSREGAAWNCALAVAFAWAALRPTHVAGLVPVITAFVFVTVGVSVVDLIGGHAQPVDEAVHLLALAGLLLIIWQARTVRTPRPPIDRGRAPTAAARPAGVRPAAPAERRTPRQPGTSTSSAHGQSGAA